MQNFLEAVRIISLAGEYLSLTYSTFMPSGQITTGINCPWYCIVHVYVVIHFCYSVWSFAWKKICAGFLIVCWYLYCRWKPNYQERRVAIPFICSPRDIFMDVPNLTWISNVMQYMCIPQMNIVIKQIFCYKDIYCTNAPKGHQLWL